MIAAAVVASSLFGCTAQHEPRPVAIHTNGTVLVVRADRFANRDGVFRERTEFVRAVGGTGSVTTVALIDVVVRRDDGRTVALMLLREFGSAGR